jgi:regulator of sigma E protease
MGLATWVWANIIPFLFVLTVIVFFHELGHFVVARWCGVKVKVFSVGFGPELLGFTDRKGTRWKLAIIPLGGYVKFLGDENAASVTDRAEVDAMNPTDRAQSFASKSVWARAAIVAAGPIANFILAIVIFTGIFSIYGRETLTPTVDSVEVGGAAEKAGFLPGDLIVSIDGQAIQTFSDMQRVVSVSAGVPLSVTVRRGSGDVVLTATPELKVMPDGLGNQQRLGVLGIKRDPSASDVVTERYSVPAATVLAVQETGFVVERTLSYLFAVVTGRESADQLGGPIRVAQISAKVATFGFLALINLAALLSISVGLINLFPIPILDGGHLLFNLLEAIRGKPLSERVQEIGFRVGFAAILALMIFTVFQDSRPWWGS